MRLPGAKNYDIILATFNSYELKYLKNPGLNMNEAARI